MCLSKTNCLCRHCRHSPTTDSQFKENLWEAFESQVNSLISIFVCRLYFSGDHHIPIVLSNISFWENFFLWFLRHSEIDWKNIAFLLISWKNIKSSDLYLVGRKESKGPYVPNRDIMKLFTNTPEARYILDTNQSET